MPPNAQAASCVACERPAPNPPVETHLDPVGGVEYRLYSCPNCGVVFSDPAKPAGADWYARAVPLEPAIPPARDWRFRMFLLDRPGPGRLLDVGCGGGEFIQWIRGKGYASCVGFDYDERKTRQARAAGVEAYTQDWEAFCRSWKGGGFGVVTLFDVLEHVPKPRELLEEVRRLLKPGGFVAITLPNAKRPMPFGREEFDFPPHHFTRWTPEAMRSFLEREGFSVVRQDAAMLELQLFLDVMATACLLKPALSLVKRFSGRGDRAAAPGPANPDAPEDGVSPGKRRRARLFTAARFASKAVLWPFAAVLAAYYRMTRPDCGNCLYTLAKKTADA